MPKNVRLIKTMATESNTVMADPAQLMQVITNLYRNAVQAMEDHGGVLDITLRNMTCGSCDGEPEPYGTESARGFKDHNSEVECMGLKPGPYVELIVSDTGPGIDSEIMPRIFEPCFSTRRDAGHAGMGLAVVHGIVKKHGGAVRAHSRPREGATFQVLLPVVEEGVGYESHDPLGRPEGKRALPGGDEQPPEKRING
jgi:signal transduction histidine kinase